MAKDMSCARVKQCSAASIGATERHNERLNTDYANVNVVQERIPLNVHYRSPPSSYMETLRTIAAADSFDGFITELQNMGYTVKYGPRVEHMAVRHKDAQRNIRIDRLDPRFSETALREYYHKLHRMPTEMQQEYRQENAPAKPKWQPTELQPTVRRARYLGKLPRRYPKVSGFMACYYHWQRQPGQQQRQPANRWPRTVYAR